jgi:hypothetical protein
MANNTYGTKKYGTTKYGPSVLDAPLWGIRIDWEKTGVINGVNYAGLATSLEVERGRRFQLNASGSGFEPMMEGRLYLELDNDDGRFDPYNTLSPLYPYIRPGVLIDVLIRLPGETVLRPIFTGIIENIIPVSSYPERVKIVAADGIKFLKDATARVVIAENLDIDDAIQLVLNSAGWLWDQVLDESPDIIRYFYVEDSISAYTVIQKIINSCMGMFFVKADGTARYYEKNKVHYPVIVINQEDLYKEILLKRPWEVIKNAVTVYGYPLVEQNTTTLWQLYDKPEIQPGETISIGGQFTYNGETTPVLTTIAPVAGTDYSFNSQADGQGTDMTADLSVTTSVFPTRVLFTIKNNAGSFGYLILLKIRGNPLTSNQLSTSMEDATSIGLYEKRELVIDNIYLQDTNRMREMARLLLTRLKNPKGFPTMKMVKQPQKQYVIDIFDAITLNIPKLGIIGDHFLAYVKHTWLNPTGQEVETTMMFEPVETTSEDIWRFTTKIGMTSKFGF